MALSTSTYSSAQCLPLPSLKHTNKHLHTNTKLKCIAHSTTPSSLSLGNITKAVAATTLAITLLSSSPSTNAAEVEGYTRYYGTAASAANYGGYGGNANKKATAEYTYDVPVGWKERLVSKVQKGTNGTDSEFYNPKRKDEKEYLTSLPGFRSLAPKDTVLNDLALSDVSLQDMIATADGVRSEERRVGDGGQLFYDFEIDSPVGHGLIAVTCAKEKLYAHFVKAPVSDWKRDETVLRHVHDSFTTIANSE